MKDKYEISIWEDCLDWDSSTSSIPNYRFYNEQVPATYGSASQPEIKIAVIGSDTMTSPIRAEEPKLIQNINGTNVFTFKMRYKYNIQGETRDNPFLSLLVNERKVKVYWKNEWYDLVIKDCQESTDGKSITYTCKDLYINELSKNGFNLEFDTELMNNQGSTFELAQRILEGTDWGVRSATVLNNPSDITFQETEESVYEGHVVTTDYTSEGFTALGLNRSDGSEENVEINVSQKILVFYSSFNEHKDTNEKFDFYFYWAGSGANPFKTDGSNMLVTNGRCLRIENCKWSIYNNPQYPNVYGHWVIRDENDNLLFMLNDVSDPSISLEYRAKRLVPSQLLKADQLTGKQCLVYHEGANEYYAYSETEYSSANLITNCITNNKNFTSTLGWVYDDVSTALRPTHKEYEEYYDGQQNPPPYDGKGYLYLPAGVKAFNSGLSDFHTFIPNGFTKGERYIFRIKARKDDSGKPEYSFDDPFGGYCDLEHTDHGTQVHCNINVKPQIFKYKIVNGAYTLVGDSLFDVANPTQFGDWISYEMTCNQSISYNDITKFVAGEQNGYGFFLDNNGAADRFPDAPPSTNIWIEDVQFFKRAEGTPIVQDYDAGHTYMENDYVKVTNGSSYKIYRCIRANSGHTPPNLNVGDYDTYWYVRADNNTSMANAIVYPGSFNTDSLANVVWKIYQPNDQIKNIEDIVYLFSGNEVDFKDFLDDNSIVPKYGPNGRYEKIRSITGKQSNRFNLLQSIAETFQVWIKFVTEHESDGRTKRVNDKPVKYIRFLNTVGENNGLCFTYGIDLKSISRTINSDTITSKVIVSQNNNEFGKDGFCSIARAKDNYPMVDYILNFDYYFSHNLLSKDMVMNDLYYTPADPYTIDDGAIYLGYYTRLHEFNSDYDAATQKLLQKNLEYTKADSKREFIEAAIKSTNQEIESLQNDLANYAGYQIFDADKVQEYLDGRGKRDVTAHNAWETMWSLSGQLEVYKAQYSNIVALISDLESIIQEQEQIQSSCVTLIKQIDDKFFSKYAHFIQEGTWTSDQYYDDDLYYFDALSTSYTSSRPQITYNIAVFRISSIKGFENKIFRLGDIAYVQDTEFFGYQADKVTPYKEEVIISEITSNFDAPQNDEIKVQNHKTQFEDLFQRIAAATQSLQFSSGAYDNTVNNFTHGGTLKGDNLQDSINQTGDLSWAADNNTVLFTKEGLMIMDPENPSKIVKITPSGISFTEDGGGHWSPAITGKGTEIGSILPGLISTDRISIMGGEYPTFNWDHSGINAYSYTEDSSGNVETVDDKKFVRFDRFGLYGVNKTTDSSFSPDWQPTTEDSVWEKGQFGLTWKGFFLNTDRTTTSGTTITNKTKIEISSENDFLITDTTTSSPVRRLKIGNISTSSDNVNYGIEIYDNEGSPTFHNDSYGNIQLDGVLRVGPYINQQSTVINGNIPGTSPSTEQVINACDNFIVYADGSVEAKNIRIEGGSIDASASIIGEIGGFRVVGDRLVSTNTTGPTLILNGGAGTISGFTPWVEVTDTLSAGSTSITIQNAAIASNSTLDIYVDVDGVYPTTKTVASGSLTLTFEAQQNAVQIKVRIS